jgi:hypothetical protein
LTHPDLGQQDLSGNRDDFLFYSPIRQPFFEFNNQKAGDAEGKYPPPLIKSQRSGAEY